MAGEKYRASPNWHLSPYKIQRKYLLANRIFMLLLPVVYFLFLLGAWDWGGIYLDCWSVTGEVNAASWSVAGAAGGGWDCTGDKVAARDPGCAAKDSCRMEGWWVEDDALPSRPKLCLLTRCGGEETKASKAWADGRLDRCERRGGIYRKGGNKYLELTLKILNTVYIYFFGEQAWLTQCRRNSLWREQKKGIRIQNKQEQQGPQIKQKQHGL